MQDSKKASCSDTLAALFLVAGCCIGGGMLAMPVATGVNGFGPSCLIMVVCWLAMTLSALLLVEASLWMEEGAHVITITTKLLGRGARLISWLIYLFICYASLIGYTAGAAAQMTAWWNLSTATHISITWGAVAFLAIFISVIYFGRHLVGQANTLLFVIMIAAYFALVAMGSGEVHTSLLSYSDWRGAWSAVPLLLTSFSFQTMVPSLVPLLKRDIRALRWAVVGGTTTALLVYAIWQTLILGIVPVEGTHGLRAALEQGVPATLFLRQHVEGQWVVAVAEFFAYFAIATSFLAIGLGLWDFLTDGLKLSNTRRWHQWLLVALIAVPVAIGATQFERVFYLAFETTGGFGDTIINGIFPALMVWMGRYRLGYGQGWRLPGGRLLLLIVIILFATALLIEIGMQLGLLSNAQRAYDALELHDLELP